MNDADTSTTNPETALPADSAAQPNAIQEALAPAAAQPSLRTITSEAIFRGSREVLIAHQDQVYRLRITRSGKLILQK